MTAPPGRRQDDRKTRFKHRATIASSGGSRKQSSSVSTAVNACSSSSTRDFRRVLVIRMRNSASALSQSTEPTRDLLARLTRARQQFLGDVAHAFSRRHGTRFGGRQDFTQTRPVPIAVLLPVLPDGRTGVVLAFEVV